ncbi:endonuclease [Paenibacillus sp. FSL H7-0326]|uniref:restriction endonuclease n=1 Tax=Paenibacillus sp. FSL H7-0326 TaxID=1921144 RepID=UPI00096F2E57|nr:restriction endonuclease [Paenibacillus sp. FSL H7-0326]OMC64360.1 endonuclease [Paenibacillus sp. FSL H7-0326]
MLAVIYAIVAAIMIVIAARIIIRISRKRRRRELNPYKITIKDIDRMEDGKDFEEYLFRLLLALGYEDAYKTVSSRDFGADLVFTDRNGNRAIIQAKRYAVSNPVGLSAVQEIYSAMPFYRAQKSIVITSGIYTDACLKLAGYNGVRLLDREDLIDIMNDLRSRHEDAAMDLIEAEPELLLDSWDDYLRDKQYKKERLLRG